MATPADSLRLECLPLAAAAPHVLAFRAEERLGEPYEVHVFVDLAADAGGPLEAALGQDATLHVGQQAFHADPQLFHGIVFESELVLAAGQRRVQRLLIAPRLRALSLGHHSRVFVDMAMPDVVQAILSANQITSFELRLTGTYAARKHVCQYRESDLAFLHRWFEREGIYYYFLQDGSEEKLVITDDKDRHDALRSQPLRYFPSGGWAAGECVSTWSRAHRAMTQGVTLGDYDYTKPMLGISASQPQAAIGSEQLVRFEDNLQDPAEATQLAKVRGELLAAQQMTFRGHGHVLGFHPGLCFTLQEHPRDDFNAGYQITRVRHRASRLDLERHVLRQLGIPLAREGYEVEIEALPEGVQFRPERRAPWPRVPGLESALVDGGADSPYAQVDDDGRYRARLLFDEAKSPAGAATAWLRMLQPHGGAPEASHFPLRKGTEVLVAFVHGDPDRPYILGAAPTPTTPSPVTKANQTQNVIQTGAKNRIEIEDTEGQQYIDVSSPNQKSFMHLGVHAGLGDHNLVVSSVGDGLHNAVGNRDITVGGNQTEDVTGDLVEEYSSNQATHVSGSFTETVDSGKTQTISAGSTQSIDGGLTQTVSGGETRTVNGAVGESISGGRTQTIHGATTESISGSLGQTVTGAVSISTPATYQLSASAGITMMTPASGTLKGTGGVTLIAPGSQTTVDSEFRKIGFDHGVQYCVRGTYGSFTMTAAALCSRNLGMHYQAFGLKFDIKAYDNKNVATDDKYGALSLIPSPVETKGAAVHQIDTTPEASSDTGPSTGSPPGAPGAPGAPPEAPPVGPPEAPPPAAPPEFPPEVPPNPPPAAPPEPPPAAPPEPPPPAAPPEAPPGATDPAGGGAP